MKKLLPLAVIAGMTSLPAHAELAEFYGKVYVSLANFNEPVEGSYWDVVSNASRLGVKGDTEVAEGIEAFYQFEYEVSPDGSVLLKQRNSFGGIRGSFGEVYLGRRDSALKSAALKIDYSNDLAGADIKQIFLGEERFSDVFGYQSPKLGGFQVHMQTFQDQGEEQEDLFAHTSTSLTYSAGDFKASVAYDASTKSDAGFANIVRAAAQYRGEAFDIGVIGQTAETIEGADLGEAVMVSGALNLDAWRVWAQYGVGNQPVGIADGWQAADGSTLVDESTFAVAGVDYKFTSNFRVFGFSSMAETTALDGTMNDGDATGVGLELKF